MSFLAELNVDSQDRNIILAETYEYRHPSSCAIREAAATITNYSEVLDAGKDQFKVNMTSRLIGLVVVPGQHITRIELEETPNSLLA
jgi:hypothetical protein